jgi:hypothetical protein
MSLTSLLLAFAPAIAARFRPVEELAHENKRLKDELAGVMCELEVIRNGLETMTIERNAERERAGLWRREAQRQRLFERNELLPMPMGGQHALPQFPPPQTVWEQHNAMQAQQASQQLQQQMMQSAQNIQQQAYSQGLAGAQQNYLQDGPQQAYGALPVGWQCDCSPSRSRALVGDCPGA